MFVNISFAIFCVLKPLLVWRASCAARPSRPEIICWNILRSTWTSWRAAASRVQCAECLSRREKVCWSTWRTERTVQRAAASHVQCVAIRSHRKYILKDTQVTLMVLPHVHRIAPYVTKFLKTPVHCKLIMGSIIIHRYIDSRPIYLSKFMTQSICWDNLTFF